MARGRLINRTISASLKFHNLPDDTCRLLASWTIAHLDVNGVFYGDPVMVKSLVFPRRADITIEQVEGYLLAMESTGLIYRYEADGDVWQCWRGFSENQPNLRRDREKAAHPIPPTFPADFPPDTGNPPEPIRQDDGNTPAEEKLIESNLIQSKRSKDNIVPEAPEPTDDVPTPPEPEPAAIAAIPSKAPSTERVPLTAGLKFYLESFKRKRFHTILQREAMEQCEHDVGTKTFCEAVKWAAVRGIANPASIMTAARKWGKRKRGNGRDPPGNDDPIAELMTMLEEAEKSGE